MDKNSRLIALLDANVLYPAPLRDLLLNLAILDLFIPKWTNQIQNEWVYNLLKNRNDLERSQLDRTVNLMNSVFPDANIKNYAKIEKQLELPDENDKHVLAAAIKSKSNIIVTSNIKDFPKSIIIKYKLQRLTPDDFIFGLIKKNKVLVKRAFDNQLKSLKNPPMTKAELLSVLERLKLSKTIARLK